MTWKWTVALCCLVLVAGCGEKPGTERAEEETQAAPSGGMTAEGSLVLLDYHAEPPESWTSQPPANTMRLAQFTTPAVEGEEPGEAIIFFFGAGQGGSVQANLDRWSNQVKDDAGNPVEPEITKPSGTKFPTTIAEYTGTYSRTAGMGMSSEPVPGQTMIAGVVETPKGTLFIQLSGPTATVEDQRDEFVEFVKSVG